MNVVENIVAEYEGELRVSSEKIADGVGAEHRSVLQLIGTHMESLERYGPIAFEMRMGSALPQGGFGKSTRVAQLTEPQVTLLMTFMKNTAPVVAFKVALVDEFYRMRQTIAKPAELSTLQIIELARESELARIAAVERAVVAESFKEQIELNDGLTVRDFHKKYFSEYGERVVNQFFYDRGLLIDERNKRWDERTEKYKDGKNHRRPTYTGKPFFYLHSKLDRDKVRREETRVRPGAPELALVEYMTKRGFVANQNEIKEIAA